MIDLIAVFSTVLPVGKTCGDCANKERCRVLLGSDFIEDSGICDWVPTRFREEAYTNDNDANR